MNDSDLDYRAAYTIEHLEQGIKLNNHAIHHIKVTMQKTDEDLYGEIERLKAINKEIRLCIKTLKNVKAGF